jgi:hypothetical protein
MHHFKLNSYDFKHAVMLFLMLTLVSTSVAFATTLASSNHLLGIKVFAAGLAVCAALASIGRKLRRYLDTYAMDEEDIDAAIAHGKRMFKESGKYVVLGFAPAVIMTIAAGEPNPVYYTSVSLAFIIAITMVFTMPYNLRAFGVIRT